MKDDKKLELRSEIVRLVDRLTTIKAPTLDEMGRPALTIPNSSVYITKIADRTYILNDHQLVCFIDRDRCLESCLNRLKSTVYILRQYLVMEELARIS